MSDLLLELQSEIPFSIFMFVLFLSLICRRANVSNVDANSVVDADVRYSLLVESQAGVRSVRNQNENARTCGSERSEIKTNAGGNRPN